MNRRSPTIAVVIGILTATIPTYLLFQAVTYLFIVPLVLGILSILLGLIEFGADSRLSKHVGWIAIVMMDVAIILPFGTIAYHNRSGDPIVFVIPDGYRGPVTLIVDRKEGVDVPRKSGMYTYHIPASGTLVIKDDGPFRQWHSLTAIYANGQQIPIDYENSLPPDAVTFQSLGSGSRTQNGKKEEHIKNFVGTMAEMREYDDRH